MISCRSREASLLSNYIRVKATTKCYCTKFGTKTGDATKGIPGLGKSLQEAL